MGDLGEPVFAFVIVEGTVVSTRFSMASMLQRTQRMKWSASTTTVVAKKPGAAEAATALLIDDSVSKRAWEARADEV